MKRRPPSPSRISSFLNRLIAASLLALVLIGGFGLGTVYLRHQSAEAANAIKRLEQSISTQQRQLAKLGVELSRLNNSEYLQSQNAALALGMGLPSERQIVRVSVNVEARLQEKLERGLVTASSF